MTFEDEVDLRVARDVLDLPDGRLLDWTSVGPPDGSVLVYHHGTPGGALPDPVLARQAVARGLRLVTPARPGYSRSDRRPGRDVASVARDTAALLDELGAAEAYLLGWSGGGPHALACGSLLPGRVLAVAVVAGVAPYGEPDLDFVAGMGEDNVEEFGAALSGEGVLRPWLEPVAKEMSSGDADQLMAALDSLLSEVDRAALTGEFARGMVEWTADGLAGGVDGWLDDDLAFTRPWGFALADLAAVHVDVWQGSADLMVPFGHGQWLVSHVPGARAHLLDGDGHLTVRIGRIGRILDTLLEEDGDAAP